MSSPHQREFRRRGLADDDAANCAQPFDTNVVPLRDMMLEKEAAPGRHEAAHEQIVLDRNRDSVERTAPAARPLPNVRLFGCAQGALAIQKHESVQDGLQPLAAREIHLHQLRGGDSALI